MPIDKSRAFLSSSKEKLLRAQMRKDPLKAGLFSSNCKR